MPPDLFRTTYTIICRLIFLFVAVSLGIGNSVPAQPASITIIYPKPDFQMITLDSTFILGNIKSNARRLSDLHLTVNETETAIHQDGGWLGWVPIQPGRFSFVVRVYERRSRRLLAVDSVVGVVADPLAVQPSDTMPIGNDYRPPRGDLVMLSGDEHQIALRAQPGRTIWARLRGAFDSLPLYERVVRGNAYWGRSVFSTSGDVDTTSARTYYTNSFRVTESMKVDTTAIEYLMAVSSHLNADSARGRDPRREKEKSRLPADSTVLLSRKSSYRVSLNPEHYPMTVIFADTTQTIRHAPQGGYFSIYQPMGVIAQAVGAEGTWAKLKLSATQFAWASAAALDTLPIATPLPVSQPTTIRTYNFDDSVVIECVLTARHPFRVTEAGDDELVVELFGVTSNVDWIRHDFSDSLIESIRWSQPEPEHFLATIRTSQTIWGYDAYYRGSTFVIVLHKPPDDLGHLRGKKIVVDPGHSADPGSIGPTGLTEAQANLLISLELAKELRAAGATVTMTRSDSSHVPLNSRPGLAKKADADLYISVHNNALPDGVNPLINNGVATFFYQPHSQALARAIQSELLKATGSPDYGLYNGNFAVVRPTSYPAVLVECAFMILPEDEARLKTPEFRVSLARAITSGIKTFLKEREAEMARD